MPRPLFPDITALYNTTMLLPAFLALALLLGEHIGASRVPSDILRKWFPLALAVRWTWPPGLLFWLLQQPLMRGERLGLNPPESPAVWLAAGGWTVALLLVVVLFWKWVGPHVHGPPIPFWPEQGFPPYVGLLLLAGEAFTHQMAFAILRAPALTPEAAWGLTLLGGVTLIASGMAAHRKSEGFMPRHLVLMVVGLFVGTGIVLGGYSLWAAIAWEWLFLVGVAA